LNPRSHTFTDHVALHHLLSFGCSPGAFHGAYLGLMPDFSNTAINLSLSLKYDQAARRPFLAPLVFLCEFLGHSQPHIQRNRQSRRVSRPAVQANELPLAFIDTLNDDVILVYHRVTSGYWFHSRPSSRRPAFSVCKPPTLVPGPIFIVLMIVISTFQADEIFITAVRSILPALIRL